MDLALFFLIFPAFYLAGDKVCRSLKLPFSEPAEAFIFCSALGLVAVSLAVLLLSFLGWFYPAAAWTLLGVIYLASAGRVSGLLRSFPKWVESVRTRAPETDKDWFGRFCGVNLFVLVLLAVTLALTPPAMTDALVYHLAVPKAYLEHHGLVNLPNNIYSYFPQLMEMVYLFCLALGSDLAAQLTGLGMTLLLLGALALYFRQRFSARWALLVPVIYFSTPTFFSVSASAYVDTQAAGFVFLSFYAWDLWKSRGHGGWFYLMVVFAASAVAAKLTTVIVLPLVLLAILLNAGKEERSFISLQRILIFALAGLLMLLPWWGRNYAYTGNPFAPYFLQFFGGEARFNWDAARSILQQEYYSSFGMGRGLREFLLLPWNLTFLSEKNSLRFDGEVGILYFLLIPALFWLRRRALPMATVFFIFLIFWFAHFQYIRTLAPAFTFLALLSAAGLERMTRTPDGGQGEVAQWNWRTLVPAGVSLGILFNLSLIAADWNRIQPLPYIFGGENREQFWTRHIPSYPMFRTVNEKLEKDSVVLFVYMRNLGYLSERKFISDTFFEAHTLQTILRRDASVEGIAGQLESLGATHLLFDNRYVFGEDSAFSPEEREALKNFLNSNARLVEGKNGYYLYGVM
ncbi:MAG: hypothetical protein V3U37_06870 [Nitrospinaceae bacterium]